MGGDESSISESWGKRKNPLLRGGGIMEAFKVTPLRKMLRKTHSHTEKIRRTICFSFLESPYSKQAAAAADS